jgi:hypothetical protein
MQLFETDTVYHTNLKQYSLSFQVTKETSGFSPLVIKYPCLNITGIASYFAKAALVYANDNPKNKHGSPIQNKSLRRISTVL